MAGRDTLALMPTGSGKSLTYQLAAMLRPEPTLVLSPLIALMKDQVDKLPPRIAETATFVNSSLDGAETAARLDAVAAGRTRLLYAAPERLRSSAFVDTLRRIGVGLVVVDEVHCVSMWGHDFRPDYLFIRHALEEIGSPAVLGMTATATPATAGEIADALGRESRGRAHERVAPEPPLRHRRRDRPRGAAQDRDRPPATPRRRLGDRLRALAALVREPGPHPARPRARHRALPRRPRAGRARARPGRLRRRAHPRRRRHHGLRHGHRQGRRAPRLPRQLPRLARELRADGRTRRPRRAPERHAAPRQPVGRDCGSSLRGRRHTERGRPPPRVPGLPRRRRPGGAGGARRASTSATAIPACSSACSSRPGSSGVASTAAARCGSSCFRSRARSTSMTCSSATRPSPTARVEQIVRFGESRTCRHRQVAEHFGEQLDGPCGACDVCAPRADERTSARPARALPADVARAIVAAVAELRWPLGRRSLVAMLRGSQSAPPSARRSGSFGLLEAASDADAKRWVASLVTAGALQEIETEEGYRVIVAVPSAAIPDLGGGAVGAGRRRSRHAASRLAARTLARRRCARVRRPPRRDARGARCPAATDARRALDGERRRADEARPVRRGSARGDRTRRVTAPSGSTTRP